MAKEPGGITSEELDAEIKKLSAGALAAVKDFCKSSGPVSGLTADQQRELLALKRFNPKMGRQAMSKYAKAHGWSPCGESAMRQWYERIVKYGVQE